MNKPVTRYPLGKVVITATARDAIAIEAIQMALARHERGDWGNVSASDFAANDHALVTRGRLLSVYEDSLGTTFWIITEGDRSSTTILLPEDY